MIGNVVNTVQRLQTVASPGQLVINQNAYVKVKESFKCREIGEVSLKNKAEPEIIFEVLE